MFPNDRRPKKSSTHRKGRLDFRSIEEFSSPRKTCLETVIKILKTQFISKDSCDFWRRQKSPSKDQDYPADDAKFSEF